MTVQCTMSLQTANQNWFKPPSRQSIVNPMCMQKLSAEKVYKLHTCNCGQRYICILLIATKKLASTRPLQRSLNFS